MGKLHYPVWAVVLADRLREMGAWLDSHGDAIYSTRGGPYMPMDQHSSTCLNDRINFFVFRDAPERMRIPKPPSGEILGATPRAPEQMSVEAADGYIHLTRRGESELPVIVELTTDVEAKTIAPFTPSGD